MKTSLEKARGILESGTVTCALVRGDTVHTSTERGVKPLLAWINEGTDLKNFSAADKVVDKATAHLYCLLGVKEVYAAVISTAAVKILLRHGIAVLYAEEVKFIWNHRRTGPCPMEDAVRDIDDPTLALDAIRTAIARLKY